MSFNMDRGCSVAAQPPVANNWNVRIIPASPNVLPQAIVMVVAATNTVGGLLNTIAGEHGLPRGRIRLSFAGRVLRETEVLNAIPRFQDGCTLILHLMAAAAPAAAVAAVGAAGAVAAGAQQLGPVAGAINAAINARGGMVGILNAAVHAAGGVNLFDALSHADSTNIPLLAMSTAI